MACRPKGIPSLAFYEGLVDKERAAANHQPSLSSSPPGRVLKSKMSPSPGKRVLPTLLSRKRKLEAVSLHKLKKKVKIQQDEYLKNVKSRLGHHGASKLWQDGSVPEEGSLISPQRLALQGRLHSVQPESRPRRPRKDSHKSCRREDPGELCCQLIYSFLLSY